MTNALKSSLMAVLMGWMGLGMAVRANAEDSKPRLAVCVHNYVGMSSATLNRAEQIAHQIFEQAGVETTWMELAPITGDGKLQSQDDASCSTPFARVEINIVDQPVPGLRSSVLGLAPGSNKETERYTVYVFDQVAKRIAQNSIANMDYILGHAMAHELGHILAQIERHSLEGIMRANWQREDFEAMMQGYLNFDADQAARIRNEVTRRTRKQAMPLLAADSH